MSSSTLIDGSYEELASRENNGIHVSLMWSRAGNDLKVGVYDSATDCEFELPVGDLAPLDVFYHPFAHAAFQGVSCDEALCVSGVNS
jgi:hypothetical protein